MGNHFNQLTPAELERLAVLSEELGEAQQIVGKILRHGYCCYHPVTLKVNRELLEKELGDIKVAIKLMFESGDINEYRIDKFAKEKVVTIRQYLHHQGADSGKDE